MLTPAWTQLRPHPIQQALWTTRARFVAAFAGRGSGKTELARRRVVRFLPISKPWSDPLYYYALPTLQQAKRVAWPTLKLLTPPEWIKKISESDLTIETVYGSTLHVLGMDKPQRFEGTQWDGGVLDESSDQRPKVFDLTVLPALSHRNGWCWRIGVPKRYGIGAADFRAACLRMPDKEHASFTWSSEEILTPEQVAWARANLDAKDYNEQYLARWEDVGGAIFYAFDESLDAHSDLQYDPTRPLLIGSDFNVNPMAWVIAQQNGPYLDVLDEIWLRNTNTRAAMDWLWRKYGDPNTAKRSHRSTWEFYGDASSRARKTSSVATDFLIIKNDTRFKAQVFYPSSNPHIQDRFAACNARFCSASGQRSVRIDRRCRQLIIDLNTRSYIEGTREPNDVGDIGHISDAFGYMIFKKWPLRYTPPTSENISYGVFIG